jgi:hypothetical protein
VGTSGSAGLGVRLSCTPFALSSESGSKADGVGATRGGLRAALSVGRLELHCTRLPHPRSRDCRWSDLRFLPTRRDRPCPPGTPCDRCGTDPARTSGPHPYQGSLPGPVLAGSHLGRAQCLPPETTANRLDSDGVWTKRGPPTAHQGAMDRGAGAGCRSVSIRLGETGVCLSR